MTRLTYGIPYALVDSKIEGRGRFRVRAGGGIGGPGVSQW